MCSRVKSFRKKIQPLASICFSVLGFHTCSRERWAMRQPDKSRHKWKTRLKYTLRITTDDWSTNVTDVNLCYACTVVLSRLHHRCCWHKQQKYRNFILLPFNERNVSQPHRWLWSTYKMVTDTGIKSLNMLNKSFLEKKAGVAISQTQTDVKLKDNFQINSALHRRFGSIL